MTFKYPGWSYISKLLTGVTLPACLAGEDTPPWKQNLEEEEKERKTNEVFYEVRISFLNYRGNAVYLVCCIVITIVYFWIKMKNYKKLWIKQSGINIFLIIGAYTIWTLELLKLWVFHWSTIISYVYIWIYKNFMIRRLIVKEKRNDH